MVAGIFATIAALVTLFIGGLGTAFEAESADVVVGLGWGVLFFSFLTIVLGAVAIGAKSRVTGVLLILSSIVGAVLGGTLVAICLALSLVGCILATIAKRDLPAQNEPRAAQNEAGT